MKDFLSITSKEFDDMSSGPIDIIEKLDMIYFKVTITRDDVYAKKTPFFERLSDEDIAINDIYKSVRVFVNETILPLKDKLLAEFGNCEAGFFYHPVKKTKSIEYHNMTESTFIYSDLYTEKRELNDFEKFKNIVGTSIKQEPYIYRNKIYSNDTWGKLWDAMRSKDVKELTSLFLEGKTFTGNDENEILGFIISSKGRKYKVIVNERQKKTDKYIKMMYRDKVISDFINVIDDSDLNVILNVSDDYLLRISLLFVEYINKTDIFTKMLFDNDDLVPPIEGYVGDVCFDKLSPTAKLICGCDESGTYKNILKILINTFKTKDTKTFSDAGDKKVEKFLYILNRIHS